MEQLQWVRAIHFISYNFLTISNKTGLLLLPYNEGSSKDNWATETKLFLDKLTQQKGEKINTLKGFCFFSYYVNVLLFIKSFVDQMLSRNWDSGVINFLVLTTRGSHIGTLVPRWQRRSPHSSTLESNPWRLVFTLRKWWLKPPR